MLNQMRRKLLVFFNAVAAGSAVAAVRPVRCAVALDSEAGEHSPASLTTAASVGPGSENAADDQIFQDALEWVAQLHAGGDTVLFYPISRLQRWSRLGYNRSCALAAQLEQHGQWTIGFDKDGTRYARLHPQEHGWV